MPEGFEEDNADCGGEIQAANARILHRNLQAIVPVSSQKIFRKTTRFTAKYQAIIGLKTPVSVNLVRLCREIDEASLRQMFIERSEIFVTREIYFRPVVEACASHGAIVHTKACDADDVKWCVGGGAQPSDVARVGRNLRFDERDGNHEAQYRTDMTDRTYSKRKRNDELRLKVSSFLL